MQIFVEFTAYAAPRASITAALADQNWPPGTSEATSSGRLQGTGAPSYIAALQLAARCNMEQQKPAETISGVFSVNDFCHWANIGRTAVYAELKAGRLTARKFGRRTIIPVSEAEKWLASLPIAQGRHSH